MKKEEYDTFQFTLHVMERRFRQLQGFKRHLFQFTLHVMERLASISHSIPNTMFQFTLHVMERLCYRSKAVCTGDVSIHAPRNGATPAVLVECCFVEVSIHAPRNGATAIFDNYSLYDFTFLVNYTNLIPLIQVFLIIFLSHTPYCYLYSGANPPGIYGYLTSALMPYPFI